VALTHESQGSVVLLLTARREMANGKEWGHLLDLWSHLTLLPKYRPKRRMRTSEEIRKQRGCQKGRQQNPETGDL
jgi:hypothetical protein